MHIQKLTLKVFSVIVLLTSMQTVPAVAGDSAREAAQVVHPTQATPYFALQNRPGCRMMMGFMAGFNQMMAMSQQPQQRHGWVQTWPWMWQPAQPAPRVTMKVSPTDNGQG